MSEELQIKWTQKKKKGLPITIGIVLILIAAISAWSWDDYNAKQAAAKAEKQYKANMLLVVLKASTTAAKAEDMINTYQQVWHDEFLMAGIQPAMELFTQMVPIILVRQYKISMASMLNYKKQLTDSMNSINITMSKLKNPPSKYSDLYKDYVDLYSSLSSLVNKATNNWIIKILYKSY